MTNREQWLDWLNNLPTCRLVRMICSCTDCGDCAVFGKPNCRVELFKWLEYEAEIAKDKKMTNGDWLRSQGDEEMAELIAQSEVYSRAISVIEGDDESAFIVKDAIIKWLEEEHEDE